MQGHRTRSSRSWNGLVRSECRHDGSIPAWALITVVRDRAEALTTAVVSPRPIGSAKRRPLGRAATYGRNALSKAPALWAGALSR